MAQRPYPTAGRRGRPACERRQRRAGGVLARPESERRTGAQPQPLVVEIARAGCRCLHGLVGSACCSAPGTVAARTASRCAVELARRRPVPWSASTFPSVCPTAVAGRPMRWPERPFRARRRRCSPHPRGPRTPPRATTRPAPGTSRRPEAPASAPRRGGCGPRCSRSTHGCGPGRPWRSSRCIQAQLRPARRCTAPAPQEGPGRPPGAPGRAREGWSGAAGVLPWAGFGEDDLLDACAAAWTAVRRARGEAESLPAEPEVFSDGIPAAIWV